MSGQNPEIGSLRHIWSVKYEQYEEFRYNGRSWDFVAYRPASRHAAPETPQKAKPPDSAYGSSPPIASPGASSWAQSASAQPGYGQSSSASRGSAFPRGEGALVKGNYSAQLGTRPGNLHYEELNHSYYVRDRKYFVEGKVFSVMFNETAGETATGYNKSISEVRFVGNRVYTSARRFVVVRVRREFCYACPIFTYSGRATLKEGVRPKEHGIVYSDGQEPKLVTDDEGNVETGIVKRSIGVEMAPGEKALHVASRIYYGIHHPVQYNVKVKDIGHVLVDHLPALIGNWKAEDNNGDKQAAEVTADAQDESEELGNISEESREEPAISSRKRGKQPEHSAQNKAPQSSHSKDPHSYHPTNNIYGYHEEINPHMYHPKHNKYGYHHQHNTDGYHPTSNPYSYHPDHNALGYHPSKNQHSYHPSHNALGYHPQRAPFCWHPQFCPYGYHSKKNPFGFHPQVEGAGGNFHPQVNPLGFHPSHNEYEYHPRHNRYAYHKKNNPSGYHPKHNVYSWHPTLNRPFYHAEHNPFGYHPTHRPTSFHPHWNPNGTSFDHEGNVIDSDSDEDDDDDEDEEPDLYSAD